MATKQIYTCRRENSYRAKAESIHKNITKPVGLTDNQNIKQFCRNKT